MAVIEPRRELLNARVYFIPAGTVVDAVTVSATTWPDNSPTTNYTDWMLHDTEKVTKEKTYDTETFSIPKAAGGYTKDDENTLAKVLFTGETAKTRDILKQLEWGLASAPTIGTAQAPFTEQDDYLEGVALLEFQNKTGAITERLQIWARLRLANDGEVGPTNKKLTYTLEYRDSGNNTYLNVA